MCDRYFILSIVNAIWRRIHTSLAFATGLLLLVGTTLAFEVGDIVEGQAVVVSGDSLEIGEARVQIFAIDAPDITDPYGEVAIGLLGFFTRGLAVRCKVEHFDRNQRPVARCVSCETGFCLDLAEEMLKSGHASADRRLLKGHLLEQIYIHLETQARAACRGLWIALPECELE